MLLFLVLVAGCPGCSGSGGTVQPVGTVESRGFTAFENNKLKLAEISESQISQALRDRPEYRLVKHRQFDLDGDGTPEKISLQDGEITVQIGSGFFWCSPRDWWVDYFFLGDADNDGTPELNLLVWKQGSFGPQRPFWVKGEDKEIKNHLFIFRLEKGDIKPVWQSSNLDMPNHWAALLDINDDGENELVAVEGSYTNPGKRKVTIWKWNGWGFSRLDIFDSNDGQL
ncbi:MAG: VCBS repeat-containing protein [Firmicutes bacterium]|nr:VCBS repeat-containing protein [Bacillota bacterium]